MGKHTRGILAGSVKIGAGAPVSVQSMTNTDTADAKSTLGQIERLEAAGCEIVRVSVYNMDCVRAIPAIKAGTHIPLVADIHFDHRLAIASIEAGIDKLRFNPGNIGDASGVRALVKCAMDHHVPVRVGVNGGSLEADLLKKYGSPVPQALVESAMRHVAILEDAGFYDTVISIKTSNVSDTVKAYRMIAEKCSYPLHMGVTEAGSGEDALVKSSIGIGALLVDGIGDTIRVSMTGDPVLEVSAGLKILRALGLRRDCVEIISCPTCGRCTMDTMAVIRRVREELGEGRAYLKVAVMGCVVNGPGEAREADIGIAFAEGGAVVFQRGERAFSGKIAPTIDAFIEAAKAMLQERESKADGA